MTAKAAVNNGASPEFNLDALLAQREESRGGDGHLVYFTFADKQWSFIDPMFMTDDEKEQLADLNDEDDFTDVDLAAWYMGEEQYDKFTAAGGNASIFLLGFRHYIEGAQAQNSAGKSSTPNRSSRRRRRS